MSENDQQPDPQPEQPTEDARTGDQDTTDWKSEARKWEQRAKANASAADELTKLKEAEKTELQRLHERAEQAESRLAQSEVQNMHARLAAEFGVPVEAIHGDDEDTARQSAQKVVEWASSTFQPKKRTPSRGLQSGASPSDRLSGKERAAQALRQMRTG